MYVYGPVLSWRLGVSLGLDITCLPKKCSFDCVYCQLGRTEKLVCSPFQSNIKQKVLSELEEKLTGLESPPDYITFSGTGEPTLNLELGEIIDGIKGISKVPVAVITNSSFTVLPEVRASLNKSDLVVAKLDAPTQELFEKINRPCPGVKLDDVVEGISKLETDVALQMMFFRAEGIDNTTEEVVSGLVELAEKINPVQVQVDTPSRPSEEKTIALNEEELSRIAARFEEKGIPTTYYHKREFKKEKLIDQGELEAAVLELVKRRPCTPLDVMGAFGVSRERAEIVLSSLVAKGLLRVSGRFYIKK